MQHIGSFSWALSKRSVRWRWCWRSQPACHLTWDPCLTGRSPSRVPQSQHCQRYKTFYYWSTSRMQDLNQSLKWIWGLQHPKRMYFCFFNKLREGAWGRRFTRILISRAYVPRFWITKNRIKCQSQSYSSLNFESSFYICYSVKQQFLHGIVK